MEPDSRGAFAGVRKAMFTRNGFNIYPRGLERVLAEDPRLAAYKQPGGIVLADG
jgi:acyl-CoA synthetase (AMP-forming)/AMP-acid ligase II